MNPILLEGMDQLSLNGVMFHGEKLTIKVKRGNGRISYDTSKESS